VRLWDSRTPKRLTRLAVFLGLAVIVCWFSMIRMPLKSFRGPLPPLTSEQAALREELQRDVQKLAGDIGERNTFTPSALHAAADYIEARFTNAGLAVTRQSFTAMGERCDNLITEIPGSTRRQEIVVVGGHYDSVQGVPGANDNATGTAATLYLPADSRPNRRARYASSRS
jgi:hypothetical protein